MATRQKIENAVTEYAKKDLDDALIYLTSLWVGLNEAYVKLHRGYDEGDEKKKIEINGGYRDITIHAIEAPREDA